MTTVWTIEKRFESIGTYVRLRTRNNGLAVEFEVKCLQLHDDGNGEPYKFIKKGSTHSGVYTQEPDEGENLIIGVIKWDGCSDVEFTSPMHGCSRSDMTRIGELFERLFDLAGELMPEHKENLE